MFFTADTIVRPDCKFVGLTTALFGVVALFFYLSVSEGHTSTETPDADLKVELAECREALAECLQPKVIDDNAYVNELDDLQKRIQAIQTQEPPAEQILPAEPSE